MGGLSRLEVVQALWVEGPLSPLEQLSIRSFLAQGHEYHLYSYGEVPGLPAGARLLPAEEILPASAVFRYRSGGSYAGFSNLFRYKLLHERGGWWADTDMVCLRPLDFEDDWVFASERLQEGGTLSTTGLVKAPAGNPLCADCFERGSRAEDRDRRWGAVGPRFFHEAVVRHGLTRFVRPPELFCPVDWWRSEELLAPGEPPAEAYTVHLWNEMWRCNGWPKDACHPPEALYQRLHGLYRV